MSNKSTLLVSSGIFAAIIVGIIFVLLHTAPTTAGAIVSQPDITATNYTMISATNGLVNGGILTTAARITPTAATTTVCAIQSPTATSTLVNATVNFSVSSTTANTIVIATSTNAFATTSLLNTVSFAANSQATVVTATSTMNGEITPPSTWIVVGMQGGTGSFSPTGICTATFELLN